MKIIGVDLGSISTKLIILDEEKVFFKQLFIMSEKAEIVGAKSIQQALAATSLNRDEIDLIVATGRSRHVSSFADLHKGIHMCLLRGAYEVFPNVRTIIDVGAENSVAISVNNKGQMKSFAGNDKCAAGGGVFLEAMAKVMDISLDEFISEAMKAEEGLNITSTCVIFAEQEALSYSFEHPPPPRAELLAGLHKSLAFRVSGLAMRAGLASPVFLCGGVSMNSAFVRFLKNQLSRDCYVPDDPQYVAALGAAIYGRREFLNNLRRE